MTTTTGNITDLAAATPVEIDTDLVRVMMDYQRADQLANAERIDEDTRADALDRMGRLAEERRRLDLEYARRPWRRWYWVPQGHLHDGGERDTERCRTLYESTQTGIDPRLSGADLPAAVERWGWHVCTVCAPDAPVHAGFRTAGTRMAEQAAQDGTCFNAEPSYDANGRRYRGYGDCAACGARGVSVTSTGRLRKHESAEWRAAKDRAERLDPTSNKIGTPTGERLRIDGNTIATVISARNAWYWHKENAERSRRADRDDLAVKYEGFANQAAEALAAKAEKTVDAWLAEMEPKLAAKFKRWFRPA